MATPLYDKLEDMSREDLMVAYNGLARSTQVGLNFLPRGAVASRSRRRTASLRGVREDDGMAHLGDSRLDACQWRTFPSRYG